MKFLHKFTHDLNRLLSEEFSSRVAECTRLILVRMGLEET
jgi:hypothetical protein